MHSSRLSSTTRPLHVLCACDTFKGTLPSDKVGEAVEAGYRQVWKTLRDRQGTAPSASTDTLRQHTLPHVALPSFHDTNSSGNRGGKNETLPAPPAAGLLAASLLAHRHHRHHHHHHHHQTCLDTGAAESSATVSAVSDGDGPVGIPADFSHTPMSDGGAGLLDSVTFAASLEARRGEGKSAAGDTETASAATNTAAAATAATAGAAVTFHAPPQPSDALHLRRVYVPGSTHITGPLGTPIIHTATDATTEPSSSTSTGGCVSFACDIARRVLVVEMAEAAGLPRITHPHDRDPTKTTSYGVGELIRYALRYMEGEIRSREATLQKAEREEQQSAADSRDQRNGKRNGVRLFLGIGGSATNDGGLGALQALGLEIYVQSSSTSSDSAPALDAKDDGVRLDQPFRGGDLGSIAHVRMGSAMQRLFPYLQCGAALESVAGGDSDDQGAALHIAEVCLICDVDNPLVGPHGATYTFGPQKCAPPLPPPSPSAAKGGDSASSSAHAAVGDDAAVGAITSAKQKALLDSLEAGMRHAAARVVGSTWQQLMRAADWPRLRESVSASMPVDQHAKGLELSEESILRADLLYRPGGGGAGGMSGFFRYLLRASYVPGADMVGGLLGLYETPHVELLLGSDVTDDDALTPTASAVVSENQAESFTLNSPAVRHPHGCLFHSCDVVVSGEGSFDNQTISSHKTVGRLLEMCTAANAYRLWRYYCHPSASATECLDKSTEYHYADGRCRTIAEFLVVCGRTSFDDYASCQSAMLHSVCNTLLPPAEETTRGEEGGESLDTMRIKLYLEALSKSSAFLQSSDAQCCSDVALNPEHTALDAADILTRCCVPRVTVLPLTPVLFSFADATQRPYACVTSAVADLLEDSARRLIVAEATPASSS